MKVHRLEKNRLETLMQDAKPCYNEAEALTEANRCLFCYDAPCIQACPTEIDIPGFIKKIVSQNVKGSAKTILKSNMLGTSCARVCPVEVLCVGACVYNDLNHQPIQIGRLQRYAMENGHNGQMFEKQKPIGKKVALVGAGPASLACAAILALEGAHPVIFEKDSKAGGLNTTGVAPYKLFAQDSLDEVAWIESLGVEIRLNQALGDQVQFDQLTEYYDAVFLGMGLGPDRHLLNDERVWPATQLIAKIKNEAGFQLPDVQTAVVVGGGNTALDVARELAYLDVPEVLMVYRKTAADMSGYQHEWQAAQKQGVRMLESNLPMQVNGDPIESIDIRNSKTGQEHNIPAQLVVEAIGQVAWAVPDVETDDRGRVKVNEHYRTNLENVFAGGDLINGGKEVVNAVAHGRDAAVAMLEGWGVQSRFKKEEVICG